MLSKIYNNLMHGFRERWWTAIIKITMDRLEGNLMAYPWLIEMELTYRPMIHEIGVMATYNKLADGVKEWGERIEENMNLSFAPIEELWIRIDNFKPAMYAPGYTEFDWYWDGDGIYITLEQWGGSSYNHEINAEEPDRKRALPEEMTLVEERHKAFGLGVGPRITIGADDENNYGEYRSDLPLVEVEPGWPDTED